MPRQKLSCFDAALKMLSRRGYAVKEIAGKLKEKGYPSYEIAEVIDRLLDKNWLNDEKFAVDRVRYRAEFSKWGKAKIQQELKQKGVEERYITQALSFLVDPEEKFDGVHDFQETATGLLQRRFGAWPEQFNFSGQEMFEEKQALLKQKNKEKQKRLNFLLRRGFSMQEAIIALEENMAAGTDTF